MSPWIPDGLLAAAVIAVAWRSLVSPDPFRAAVLYIAFGLLAALIWVRLRAPDLALADAAIGAGLTGALLLEAARQIGGEEREGGSPPPEEREASGRRAAGAARESGASGPRSRVGHLPGVLGVGAAAAVAAFLLLGLARLPHEPGRLGSEALARVEETGVEHPVTAVLLGFRAYDTWLELAVLLVAVVGALALRREDRPAPLPQAVLPSPGLDWLLRLLLPLLVMAAVLVVGLGVRAPGGAFQAGAVLASAAVLMAVAGRDSVEALPRPALAGAWTAGVAAFLVLAAATSAAGSAALELPASWAGPVLLVLEIAITASITVTLSCLFLLADPGPRP